ncbi:MAG: ABC transporter permease [Gemmatimonadota bacterium]
MGKLWTVIRREYVERVRSKWFVIVTLFGPLFFGTVMVLPGYLSVRAMREARVANIRIIDATGAGLGARVARRLAPTPLQGDAQAVAEVDTVAPDAVAAAEAALLGQIQQRTLVGVLTVDATTLQAGTARYMGRNAGSVGEVQAIESAIKQALIWSGMEAAGIATAQADALLRLRVRVSAERVTDEGKGGSGLANTIFGFGVAFLLYFSIVFYGQAILRGVLEEKTTRVAEVIVASVQPDVLLAGKVIGVGSVGLTQQLVWLASGVGFYTQRGRILDLLGMEGMPPLPMPSIEAPVLVALMLFFLLGYTLYASLFAAVGAMVGSQEEAQQAAQPVIMLLVFSIIFAQPVLTNPTSRLAEVMSWIPFSAPIIMPMRMTATPVSWTEITLSLVGVALASAACVWLAARIYRVGLLMYGKRPGLGELLRWIKQS